MRLRAPIPGSAFAADDQSGAVIVLQSGKKTISGGHEGTGPRASIVKSLGAIARGEMTGKSRSDEGTPGDRRAALDVHDGAPPVKNYRKARPACVQQRRRSSSGEESGLDRLQRTTCRAAVAVRKSSRSKAIRARLVMRVLLHRRKDRFAGVWHLASGLRNHREARFMQAGRHPSPMFGSVVADFRQEGIGAANLAAGRARVMPRTRAADASSSERSRPETKVARCPGQSGQVAGDTAAQLPISRGAGGIPAFPHSETTDNPASARRVVAVQVRENMVGQLKGRPARLGPTPQAATRNSSGERKLVTDPGDRDRFRSLVHELPTLDWPDERVGRV